MTRCTSRGRGFQFAPRGTHPDYRFERRKSVHAEYTCLSISPQGSSREARGSRQFSTSKQSLCAMLACGRFRSSWHPEGPGRDIRQYVSDLDHRRQVLAKTGQGRPRSGGLDDAREEMAPEGRASVRLQRRGAQRTGSTWRRRREAGEETDGTAIPRTPRTQTWHRTLRRHRRWRRREGPWMRPGAPHR